MKHSPPRIGNADRLGVTLLFSLIAHGVLALGITFTLETPAPSLPSLDVILVQSATGQKPDKADFLAQANNTGGGESEKRVRPTAPVSSATPKSSPGSATQQTKAGAPPATPTAANEVLTTSGRTELQASREKTTKEQDELPLPRTREINERNLEQARLEQEIQRDSQAYAKRPKRKFLSASTREYEYAAYQRAWVARIERIGNLNYPDEARHKQLHGDVLLTVSLFADGRVRKIDVVQSSGHKILDDAAIRIVRLAEPFPALPKTAENPDEINITRTWQFLPGEILRDSMSSD